MKLKLFLGFLFIFLVAENIFLYQHIKDFNPPKYKECGDHIVGIYKTSYDNTVNYVFVPCKNK
jgi:hypothetical protein